jgi:p-aminobenzoyl-glutamate transporter AbgT
MFRRNWLSTAVISILIAYIVFILGSWLWSAAMPSSSIRPLLSESGIRWFFGTFVANLAKPLLIWIILFDVAIGACQKSGLGHTLKQLFQPHAHLNNLQRRGLWPAIEIVVFELIIMALLVFPRHAILLSITGVVFPSSASESFIPVIAFMLLSASLFYGLFSGLLHNYKDTVTCALRGGRHLKIILCFYVLIVELVAIVKYTLLG